VCVCLCVHMYVRMCVCVWVHAYVYVEVKRRQNKGERCTMVCCVVCGSVVQHSRRIESYEAKRGPPSSSFFYSSSSSSPSSSLTSVSYSFLNYSHIHDSYLLFSLSHCLESLTETPLVLYITF
jgi:hypothetical protein